jgi:hypothetical protein
VGNDRWSTGLEKVCANLWTTHQQLGFSVAAAGNAGLPNWDPSLGKEELVSVWFWLVDEMAWLDSGRP